MMRGRRIAAAAFGALALTSASAAAQSQDNSGTVGNPQLKNFELPGTTTVPAPPGTQPQATQPSGTQPPPPPIVTLPPVESAAPPAEAVRDTAPAPAPERRAPARSPRARAAPAANAPAPPPPAVPAPADLGQALPAPIAPPAETVPQARPQALPPAPGAAEEEGGGFPWQYLAAAALLALIGFAGYRKLRRPAQEPQSEPEAPPEPVAPPVAAPPPPPAPPPGAAPAPQPAPVPQAAATPSDAGVVGIQLRPWLEIEFRPDRAAATLTDASVQFELVIRNRGNAPARNVRIESAIFNAGAQQEQEIAAWYREPVRERTPPSIAVIPPRGEVQLKSAVIMAKDQVREIEVQGRRLFIPTVAFNVIYDWGANKSGQTSMSYVVGREPETPSEKMAPFRLDLGPRLYRSVGQRQTRVAVMV